MVQERRDRKDFSAYYNDQLNTILFRWVDWRKKVMLKRLLKQEQLKHQAPLKILELGAGIGKILASLPQSYKKYIFDVNEFNLQKGKKKGLIPLVGDLDRGLPCKNESFDVVITIDAIEHFSYRHNSLEEMLRVLKPDGLMIHFTPPYDSVTWVIAERVHNLLLNTVSDHVSPFTRESMKYFLSKGCKEIHIGWLNLGLTMYGYGWKL